MCYAIPGKIIEIKGDIAVVDYFGEHRNALNKFLNAKIGEYVYAQGGILIDKLPETEALEILTIWKERFFELKKKDKEYSQLDNSVLNKSVTLQHYPQSISQHNLQPLSQSHPQSISQHSSQPFSQSHPQPILEILQKVNLNKELTKNELLALLRSKNKDELNLIYTTANNIRQKEHDNACCVHGIIEFSNYCKLNCFYCGIRREIQTDSQKDIQKDSNIERYRMTHKEIFKAAKYAVKELGFKALVFQSGEDEYFDDEKLINLVKEISKLNILIFISIGLRTKETYKKLYDAGAKAVLLRFETSNKKLFENLRPSTSFDERIQLIKELKQMGYIVATGFLIGLPDETDEDIINNILLTKELKADMYSFGPFIPPENTSENTPKNTFENTLLQNHKVVDKNIVLKAIAISRFLDRDSNILVTTALETLDKNARTQALLAGANSLMINVTPNEFKKKYTIYKRNYGSQTDIKKEIIETINMLYSLGRAPMDINFLIPR